MAYNIIELNEINNSSNEYISVLKYAILEKNDSYYLQLKLKNISTSQLTQFSIRYLCMDEECVYCAKDVLINPDEIFFDKTLIKIDDSDFEFLEISDVVVKKEEVEEIKVETKEIEEPLKELKSYHLLRFWGFILLILPFIPIVIQLDIEAIFSFYYPSTIFNKILKILNIVFALGGVGLLISSFVLSSKAKQEDVYDKHSNVKWVGNLTILILILMVIFYSIAE